MSERTELEDIVYRFAIEHHDADLIHVIEPQYAMVKKHGRRIERMIGTAESRSWKVPAIVEAHDETAMRAYLEAALEMPDPHAAHAGRKPAVCCQAAELLGRPHPWAEECEEGDGARCPEGVCQTGRVPHDHDPVAEA